MTLKRLVKYNLIFCGAVFLIVIIGGTVFDKPKSASSADLKNAGTTSVSALDNAAKAEGTAPVTSTNNSTTPVTSTSITSPGSPSPSPTPTTPSSGGTGGGTGDGSSVGSTTPPPSRPIVTLSANPGTINSGSSSTLSWSAINNPTSCTGSGGNFVGGHPVNGSFSSGPLSSTTAFSLTCGNSGGSSTASVTVTVNQAPVCGQAGGSCTKAQVATHNSAGNCWVIYNNAYFIVTSYVHSHPGGTQAFTSQTCGQDITAYMNGSQTVSGVQKHSHSGSAYNTLNSYKVGPVSG